MDLTGMIMAATQKIGRDMENFLVMTNVFLISYIEGLRISANNSAKTGI